MNKELRKSCERIEKALVRKTVESTRLRKRISNAIKEQAPQWEIDDLFHELRLLTTDMKDLHNVLKACGYYF